MSETKYYLYDEYEGVELIDTFDSVEAATEAAREYDEETDGECSLQLTTAPVLYHPDGRCTVSPGALLKDWRY